MQQLSIILKSFDSEYLKKSLTKINLIISQLRFLSNFTIPSPTIKKKYTVLRAPHIDKKSREQFEWKLYKSTIIINSNNITKSHLLIFLLKNSTFPGIQLEFTVDYSGYL